MILVKSYTFHLAFNLGYLVKLIYIFIIKKFYINFNNYKQNKYSIFVWYGKSFFFVNNKKILLIKLKNELIF